MDEKNDQINKEGVYTVHQLIHESSVVHAIEQDKVGKDLSEIRNQILTAFTGKAEKLLEFMEKCNSLSLLEKAFDIGKESLLAEVCTLPIKVENDGNEGLSFIHSFFKVPPDFISEIDDIVGDSQSKKLVVRLIKRLLKYNLHNPSVPINITDLFVQPNERKCLLLDVFDLWDGDMDYSLINQIRPVENIAITHNRIKWKLENEKHPTDPLIMAAGTGDLEQVKKLATEENVIEKRNFEGDTALIVASSLGHLEIVKFLFELNPTKEHYEIKNHAGLDAFSCAAASDLEIVKFLYEKVEDKQKLMETKTINHEGLLNKISALNISAARTFPDIIKKMNKDNINYTEGNDFSALDCAIMSGLVKNVEFLLSKFSSVESLSRALILAVVLNNMEMVKIICESTKNGEEEIAFKIVNGYNALHLSAYFGHLDIVKYFCGDSKSNQKKLELIRMGVEEDGKGEKNAYELAAKSGNDEVSDYLEQFFDGHITELKKQLTKFVRQHKLVVFEYDENEENDVCEEYQLFE